MTTTKMTDDELTIELAEEIGAKWSGDGIYRTLVLKNRSVTGTIKDTDGVVRDVPYHMYDYAASKDALERHIYPVIRERGKWNQFLIELIRIYFPRQHDFQLSEIVELVSILLTLPARTLAEKCLEVLKDD